ASCKSADVSPRIVELDQWNTGSALNSRSPELWRKAGRRERFCYLSDVSQCAGRFVRAPIYWESTRLEATRRKLDGTAVAEGVGFEPTIRFQVCTLFQWLVGSERLRRRPAGVALER